MNNSRQLDVLIDGECPLCKWMRARVEPFDTDKRLNWRNFRDPDVPGFATPYTFDEMNEEMHVRLPEGRWVKGYQAWIEVLRVLPKWRWLSPIMAAWPLSRLGPVFYRWLAARRFTLFGVPPPCSPDGVCSLHQKHAK
jgi:predicted DCC family thiol-disulfide oxidoreductase YuxK